MDRRTWMASFGAGAVARQSFGNDTASVPLDLEVIDCHTHFFDPYRPEGVDWPGPKSVFYRTVLPEHMRELKTFRPLKGTVIVEASGRKEDNQWLLDLGKDDPFVVGVVGNLQPDHEDYVTNVKRFSGNSLFRGIRLNSRVLQKIMESNDLSPLKLLADNDLSLDAAGGIDMGGIAAKIAKAIPELQIVINHIGGTQVTDQPPAANWIESLKTAGSHDNVSCKISALLESAEVTMKKPAPEAVDFYRPYLDVVWDAFGEDRVIYGSNWPVSEKGPPYEALQRVYLTYAAEKGEAALRKFAAGNAKAIYQWLDR